MPFTLVNSLQDEFLKQFYSFKRPFQEVKGYKIYHGKDGTDTIVINALGINPEDLKVEVKPEHKMQILNVFGTTEDEVFEEEFSVNLAFYFYKPIHKIRKSFRSGLVILKIEYEVPPKLSIEIVEE